MRQKLGRLSVRVCTVLFCMLITGVVFAQKKVSGTVTSAKTSQPLAFATVTVKGTNVATATDVAGAFSITVPAGRTVLTVTSVGYQDQDVTIGSGPVNVVLVEQVSNLDEIVVTGYTAQKKKEITGSVSVVSVKDLKSVPTGTAEQMLQGQASGVTIIGSGQPGDNSNVFIRGITSFGNATPLIIVDGVQSAPGDLSTLHDLSANDIESVQVLKDGQAAIYGARGAAGVIVVTTRKGKGRATINYDGYVGTQTPLSGNPWHKATSQQMADILFLAKYNSQEWDASFNMISAQYGTISKSDYEAGKRPTLPDYIKAGNSSGVSASDPAVDLSKYNNNYAKGPIYLVVPRAKGEGTDWFHALFKNAPLQSHTLTASGGTDKSSYLFSFNYFDQTGTLLNTYLKRYAVRANTVFNVKNNIRVGENFYAFFKDNPRIGNNQEGNAVNNTGWMQPIIPLYDAGGGFGGTSGSELGNSSSPLANQVRARDNRNYDWIIQGNVFAELDFARHFTIKTLFGGNLDNNYGFYHGYQTYENKENNTNNSYGEYANYSSNWNFTNTLTYSNVFGQNHSLKVLVGYEALQYRNRGLSGSRIGYFSDDPNFLSLSTGSSVGQSNSSYYSNKTGSSILAKIDYAYKSKYLIGLNGRRDGSSVFGPKAKYGNFFSASAGWVVSQENFFKNITFINSLKLRGSYGELGSISNVPGGNQYNAYSQDAGGSYYAIDGSSSATTQGFYASQYGNLFTSWEVSKILDFGLDMSILKNRMDVSFDWYNKKIEGLLFTDQAPAVVGLGATLPLVNIGDMKNTGVDIGINWHDKINKDLSYSIGVNVTAYKNTIVNIPGASGYFETAGTHNTGNQVRNQVGHPVGSFYGYKIIGIYQSWADTLKYAKEPDAAPGRFIYQDANKDGKIDDKDRVFYGNPNPKFTYGVNLGLSYKSFDFSMVLYGSQGNDVLNYTRYFQDFYPQFQNSKSAALLTESWTPNRKNAKYPIVETGSYFSTNGVLNDFYNENGSYLRCKQISIGYTVPADLLKRAGIDRARIYVQAANLFTITKYTGLDPEIAGSTATFGVDYGNYPPSKTFNVGLNLTF